MSCSHFGAHVMGSDIDHTLLHGRGTQAKGVFIIFFKCNNQINNMLLTMLTCFFCNNYTTPTIIFSDKCKTMHYLRLLVEAIARFLDGNLNLLLVK